MRPATRTIVTSDPGATSTISRKWKVPGGSENPAAGLSVGPDVQRNRFLSELEAEALVRSMNSDENQTAARAIMLLLLTGRVATKYLSPMGLCGLEEQNTAGAQIEVRPSARHRAQSIRDCAFDGDATNRRKFFHFSIADQ